MNDFEKLLEALKARASQIEARARSRELRGIARKNDFLLEEAADLYEAASSEWAAVRGHLGFLGGSP